MGGRAGYVDYEAAFRKIQGGTARLIGLRTLTSQKSIPARKPSPPAPPEEAAARARGVGELLGRMANLLPIACPCGVGIKVPPEVQRESVSCPRCGREHPVPRAVEAVEGPEPPPEERARPLSFERKGRGWESFRCACGKVIQLSPLFAAPSCRCPRCRREIEVTSPQPAPR